MILIVKSQDEIYIASETGRITVADAMVIMQGLDQPKSVKSCTYLYVHFCQKVLLKLLDQCQARSNIMLESFQ